MKKAELFFKKYSHIVTVVIFAAFVMIAGLKTVLSPGSGILINEVCTSNVSCCEDENGNYPDWIELYNPTTDNIDISGYIVSRSADLKKEKYVIPEGTVIAPGSFYLFDPGFRLSSDGCILNLVDSNKHYKDNVRIPALRYDTTYSRSGDGSYKWNVQSPTPGYSNTDGETIGQTIDGKVIPSVQTGFYDNDFNLYLSSSNFGRTIYYTVDGSNPVTNGIRYDEPIHIYDRSYDTNVYSMIPEVSLDYTEGRVALPHFNVDKCTVVRAVSKDLLGRYTDISTFTYFVGYDKKSAYDDIPVISVSADPDDLFSYENGIMVLGKKYDEYAGAGHPDEYEGDKSNFTQKGRRSERRVCLEIFDRDHETVLDESAGIRIKGLSSRWDVQKSFSLFFRKAYGSEYKQSFCLDGVDFDLHSFALDKCGQDTSTKMVDTIMSECMRESGCATAKRVPCCLFLNGEYWGFYWLSERFDSEYLASKYGVIKDNTEYRDSDYIDSWDEEFFDRDSLIDYYAANIIVAHAGDWPQYNLRFWRTKSDEGSKYGDGRFRPVIFDMNSFSMTASDHDTVGALMGFYPFQNLVADDEMFATDLADKIDEMSRNEFGKSKVIGLIDDIRDRINDQMVLDRMRYSDCKAREAEDDFAKSVEVIRDFYEERWTYLDVQKEELVNGQ